MILFVFLFVYLIVCLFVCFGSVDNPMGSNGFGAWSVNNSPTAINGLESGPSVYSFLSDHFVLFICLFYLSTARFILLECLLSSPLCLLY